ncbi:MAG: hypothetical protein ACR2NN_27830 [Bryobacteraceae bacterium]
MQQWFLERLNFQLAVQAPFPFMLFAALGVLAGFLIAKYFYAERMEALEQRIKQAQEALKISESKQGVRTYKRGETPLGLAGYEID